MNFEASPRNMSEGGNSPALRRILESKETDRNFGSLQSVMDNISLLKNKITDIENKIQSFGEDVGMAAPYVDELTAAKAQLQNEENILKRLNRSDIN